MQSISWRQYSYLVYWIHYNSDLKPIHSISEDRSLTKLLLSLLPYKVLHLLPGITLQLDNVTVKKVIHKPFIPGDDILGLLFHFLDEFLFLMCADPYFIVKVIEVKQILIND